MKRLQIKNRFGLINCHIHNMRYAWLMVLLISLIASPAILANDFQDKKPIRTKLSLTCTQLPNHQVMVLVKLLAKPDKQYVALANAAIEIYNLTDSTEVSLGKGITDEKGLLEITVNAKDQLSINEDGYYSIVSSYEGDENYKSSDDDLLFKPAIFEMEAEVVDSVKTITIKIYEQNEDALPIEGAEVVLSVPRMFSDLPIASEFTDEDGTVSFIFPDDLPGGKNGELTIIAFAEDTDEHASLRNEVQNNWGVPTALEHHKTRELWSPDAPLWMVWTFTLLMIVVWGHFFIIIYKLYLVHKEGKALTNENI
jgi:hypothetical protein